MAEDHGFFYNEAVYAAFCPVVDLNMVSFAWNVDEMVYITAADSGPFDFDYYVVGVFELWDGSVFEGDFAGFLEDERWVMFGVSV